MLAYASMTEVYARRRSLCVVTSFVRGGRPRLPRSLRHEVGARERTPTTNTKYRCSIYSFLGRVASLQNVTEGI